jgi:putative membrane protein
MNIIPSILLIAIFTTSVRTTLILLIVFKLPLGIEIDGLQKSILVAVIIGILNQILDSIFTGFDLFRESELTFYLTTSFAANVIFLSLPTRLLQGFRLQSKIWSPVLGAIALLIINFVTLQLLIQFFMPVPD